MKDTLPTKTDCIQTTEQCLDFETPMECDVKDLQIQMLKESGAIPKVLHGLPTLPAALSVCNNEDSIQGSDYY